MVLKNGWIFSSLTISQWSQPSFAGSPLNLYHPYPSLPRACCFAGAMELEWEISRAWESPRFFPFKILVILYFFSSNQKKSTIWRLWNKSLNFIFPTKLCKFPNIYGQTERQKSWLMCADVWNLLSLKRKLLKLNEGDFGTVPIWGDLG